MIEIEAGHSHFYPGAKGQITEWADEEGCLGDPVDARILFADGASANGTLGRNHNGDVVLSVEAYKTIAGTALPMKSWVLSTERPAKSAIFRVRRAEIA